MQRVPLHCGVQVFPTQPFKAENVTATFSISVLEAPLIVHLSWMDLPSTPGTVDTLIQDLDLKVTNGLNTWWGNNVDGGDHANNDERVSGKPERGGWRCACNNHRSV